MGGKSVVEGGFEGTEPEEVVVKKFVLVKEVSKGCVVGRVVAGLSDCDIEVKEIRVVVDVKMDTNADPADKVPIFSPKVLKPVLVSWLKIESGNR